MRILDTKRRMDYQTRSKADQGAGIWQLESKNQKKYNENSEQQRNRLHW